MTVMTIPGTQHHVKVYASTERVNGVERGIHWISCWGCRVWRPFLSSGARDQALVIFEHKEPS
jgi:hypothetical protein